jgi:hypothetical protein
MAGAKVENCMQQFIYEIKRFYLTIYIFINDFTANDKDDFQTKSFVYKINTRYKRQLHRVTSKFTCFHKSVFYAGNKFFNSLPLRLTIGTKTHNLK